MDSSLNATLLRLPIMMAYIKMKGVRQVGRIQEMKRVNTIAKERQATRSVPTVYHTLEAIVESLVERRDVLLGKCSTEGPEQGRK